MVEANSKSILRGISTTSIGIVSSAAATSVASPVIHSFTSNTLEASVIFPVSSALSWNT